MVAPIDHPLTHTENPPADKSAKSCILQVFQPSSGLHIISITEENLNKLFQRALNTWSDAPEALLILTDNMAKPTD